MQQQQLLLKGLLAESSAKLFLLPLPGPESLVTHAFAHQEPHAAHQAGRQHTPGGNCYLCNATGNCEERLCAHPENATVGFKVGVVVEFPGNVADTL